MKLIVSEMKVPTRSNSWSGRTDDETIHLQIRGFRRLLSFYGRDVNDSNFKDHERYISFICDNDSRTMVDVYLIIRIKGEPVEEHWRFIGTAVTDDGRSVVYCFQEPLCETGLMK